MILTRRATCIHVCPSTLEIKNVKFSILRNTHLASKCCASLGYFFGLLFSLRFPVYFVPSLVRVSHSNVCSTVHTNSRKYFGVAFIPDTRADLQDCCTTCLTGFASISPLSSPRPGWSEFNFIGWCESSNLFIFRHPISVMNSFPTTASQYRKPSALMFLV